jgi:hypothetical protein
MELVPSLSVRVRGDSVELMVRLANGGTTPARLEFPTAQRYDFEVADTTGATLWQWSSEQMFGQSMGTETIAPAGSLEYRAVWDAGGRTGVFRAIGRVVSTNWPSELETEFELPGG